MIEKTQIEITTKIKQKIRVSQYETQLEINREKITFFFQK